jgi:hypothetical protein
MRIYFSEMPKDLPKKWGDLNLAWYQNGKICISRVLKDHQIQAQNFNIIQVNQITRAVWDRLCNPFKKDLAEYAKCYKTEYPTLRKRGISAYSVFLMVMHGLIKRFSIMTTDAEKCIVIFDQLLLKMSVLKLIRIKILKAVRKNYRLNQENWGLDDFVMITNIFKLNSLKVQQEQLLIHKHTHSITLSGFK